MIGTRLGQNVVVEFQSAGNQQQVRSVSSLVDSSETTRTTTYPFLSDQRSEKLAFCLWLAVVIDGDGSFQVSKHGNTSCEITMGIADEPCLRYIQDKLGGSIKLRSGVKAWRWRLHNKNGMMTLINCINGNIRHSRSPSQLIPISWEGERVLQLHKVCPDDLRSSALNLTPQAPSVLTQDSAWFAPWSSLRSEG